MRLKTLIQYHLWDYKRAIMIFYGIIITLFIIFAIVNLISPERINVSVGGLEIASIIFIFVAGVASFTEIFYFSLINGVSRKTQFLAFTGSMFSLAAIMAAVDSVFGFISLRLAEVQNLFAVFYGTKYQGVASLQLFVDRFLWMLVIYTLIAITGYLISMIYYHSNKTTKLIVSILPPVFFIIVLPLIDSMTSFKIFAWLRDLLLRMLGLYNNVNPYIAIFSTLVAVAIVSFFNYLLISKAEVKN